MQCHHCGSELAPGGRFCSRCGAAVPAYTPQADAGQPSSQPSGQFNGQPANGQPAQGYQPVNQGPGQGSAYGAPPPQGFPRAYGACEYRVARHVQSLAMLWVVYAVYRFATKFFGLTLFHTFLRHSRGWEMGWGPWGGGDWMGTLLPFAITTLLVSTALSLIAAYGLYTRQPWGRVMAIVAAVWSLLHPIFGTILGIYTLWVLAPGASGVEYDAMARRGGQQS